MNSAMSAAERRAHWAEVLQDEPGGPWDWRPELIKFSVATFDYLDMMMGPVVGRALSPHVPSTLRATGVPPRVEARRRSLQARVESTKARSVEGWPIHDLLRQLGLYGLLGVTEASIPLASRRAYIKSLVDQGEAFWIASPFKQAADQLRLPEVGGVIDRVVRLAYFRRVLDGDESGDIHPVALAAFGKVSKGRLLNLKAQGGILEGRRGMVSTESARRWLEKRPAFWDSVWQKEG